MHRLLFIALIAPSAALAQDTPEPQIAIPEVQHVDFGTVDVNATVEGPGGILISEPTPPRGCSFITLRADFDRELAQTTTRL